jgi:hypothetical protein
VTVDELVAAFLTLSDRDRFAAMSRMREAMQAGAVRSDVPPWLEAARIYAEMRTKHTGLDWQSHAACRTSFEHVVDGLRGVCSQRNVSLVQVLQESCAGFFADPKAAKEKWPPSWWCKDPGKWLPDQPRAVSEVSDKIRRAEARLEAALQRGDHDTADQCRADIRALVAVRRQRSEGT